MKNVKHLLIGIALAGVLAAQDSPPPAPKDPPVQSRVFEVKYADVRDLANVLSVFNCNIKSNPGLRVLAVSATPGVMTSVEDAIKRLDVPAAEPKDIEITAYLVVASQQTEASASLPAELQPVAKELRGIFAYKSFRLLDTMLVRTQTGNAAHTRGMIPAGTQTRTYEFIVRPSAVVDGPGGRLVRLDVLKLESQGGPGSIDTEITLREGQKVVVGKSNIGVGTNGVPDEALILVVSAKVIE